MQIESLIPYVLIELPGCPDFLIMRTFKEELAGLYRDHPLWIYTDTATSIDTDGVATFVLPDCTQVHEVRSMRIGDDQVMPVGMASKNDYDLETETGTPLYVFERNYQRIVRPKPVEACTAMSVLQIGPTIIAECIDDGLASRHRLIWEHLVLSRLLAMPAQSWSNMKGAATHAAMFFDLLQKEKRRADGWTSRRVPTVRYGGI